MQMSVKDASSHQEALNLTRNASTLGGKARMHLLMTALRGKADGFEKVVAIIDGIVALSKKKFDPSDDKKKAMERSVPDLETWRGSADAFPPGSFPREAVEFEKVAAMIV